MASFSAPRSSEGHHYCRESGLETGLHTEGCIQPASNVSADTSSYDVAIIGAGYAGLIAARTCAQSGLKVLLLEARDRIGGRTWTAKVNGDKWEMGGTYIHWWQGHVWQEVMRYGLERRLIVSDNHDRPDLRVTLANYNGYKFTRTYGETDELGDSALHKLFNIDGDGGDSVIPLAATPFDSVDSNDEAMAKWDEYTMQDRLDEVAKSDNPLTIEEEAWVSSWIVVSVGNEAKRAGFLDMLRWYHMGGKSYPLHMKTLVGYKLQDGQSYLARNIFEEAVETGNVEYALSTPINKITTKPEGVTIVTSDGQTFQAKRSICTIPLNVLKDITFEPPISDLRAAAFAEGHINFTEKISSESSLRDHRQALCFSYDVKEPYGLALAYGDKYLNSGGIGITCFGTNSLHKDYVPLNKAPETIPDRLDAVIPGLKDHWVRSVFSQWYDDKYAQGAWCNVGPRWHQYMRELQAPHGHVHFASADWADNWHGFIDGAMEQGFKHARILVRELKKKSTKTSYGVDQLEGDVQRVL